MCEFYNIFDSDESPQPDSKGFSSSSPVKTRPQISLHLHFTKRSIFIFKIILTMLKYKKNLQNHVHSKAFKKTLSCKREPQASFHDYYYYYKILVLLHIIGLLRTVIANRNRKETYDVFEVPLSGLSVSVSLFS